MTLKHRMGWCAAIGVVEKGVGTVLDKSECVLLIGIPDMNRENSGDPYEFTIS